MMASHNVAVDGGAKTALMDAMVLDRFGGPEVLHMAQIERPPARPGTVVIEVAYAAVNPADWKSREGWLSQYFQYRFPFVVGFDATGRVAEVGEGVTRLKPGDRVVTASNQGKGERGSYAQFVLSDIERVVKLPDSVSLIEGATLPTAGMTAWQAVFDAGETGPGKSVVVNGGAGGTGSFAIQLAKMAGASVAATCSAHNEAYVKSLGADIAIDYRTADVAAEIRAWAPQGVDVVVDTVGQGSFLFVVDCMRRGGVIAPIGTLIANEPQYDAARAAGQGVRVIPTISSFDRQEAHLNGLVKALSEGRILAPETEILPLVQAGEAHMRVKQGHVRGKLLLSVNPRLGN